MNLESLIELAKPLLDPSLLVYWLGCLLAIVVLVLIFRVNSRNRPIVPFKSGGTSVSIPPRTIRKMVEAVASQTPGIEKASVALRPKHKRLKLLIDIHLNAQSNLLEVRGDLERRIRQALKTRFGLENIRPIKIRVVKVVGEFGDMRRLLTQDGYQPQAVALRPPSAETKAPEETEPEPPASSIEPEKATSAAVGEPQPEPEPDFEPAPPPEPEPEPELPDRPAPTQSDPDPFRSRFFSETPKPEPEDEDRTDEKK